MAWTTKCPVHKIDMQLTARQLPEDEMYYFCPKWGCIQRYLDARDTSRLLICQLVRRCQARSA